MDWSRAKSVLIGIFLTLNIFLLVYLKIFYFQPSISKDTISDAVKVLEKRGIQLACEIPEKEFNYDSLDFDSNDYSRVEAAEKLLGTEIDKNQIEIWHQLEHGEKVIKFLENNELIYLDVNPGHKVNLKNEQEIESCAKDFLKGLELPARTFVADRMTRYKDSVKMRLYEKYQGVAVYDNWFDISISAKGITYMKYRYIKVKALKNDGQKRIIPAHTLLLRHFHTGNRVITVIEIGFKKPVEKKDVFIWFSEPYWRVRFDSGPDSFFNALTGAEEIMSESEIDIEKQ